MKSYAFLFWAYVVVWVVLALYLLWLGSRIGRASRRLAALEREIARREAAARGGSPPSREEP